MAFFGNDVEGWSQLEFPIYAAGKGWSRTKHDKNLFKQIDDLALELDQVLRKHAAANGWLVDGSWPYTP